MYITRDSSYCQLRTRCNLFWAYCLFQFCVSNSEDSHMKISEIEEEACDVKPTQLTVRLDPIKSRAGET